MTPVVRHWKLHQIIALGLACVIIVIATLIGIWGVRLMRETGVTPTVAAKLIFNGGTTLKSSDGRTNILLMGVGGGNHEGGDLTDTMMVLSLSDTSPTAAIISIPRDLWSDTLKDKINSAYHYGEEKKKGGGLVLARAIVEDVVGMQVHYSIVIDFSGFQSIIDQVGGVDVNVLRAFTDTKYPIEGREAMVCPGGEEDETCRYETISFAKGVQHMDGATALKYARSRHAEGDAGSDFARSSRQQDIMIALKEKMLQPLSWVTVARLKAMPVIVDDATDTDMNMGEWLTVGRRFTKIADKDIKKIAIEALLEVPAQYLYGGRYVLIPTDSFEAIHIYIQEQLR